jgi:hypothetical protein
MRTDSSPPFPPRRGSSDLRGIRLRRARFFRRVLFGGVLFLWCAGVMAGVIALWRYSSTPGAMGVAPKRWPANTLIHPRPGRATLIMLAHPHCPCTRASLNELARLPTRGEADTWVLFLKPSEVEAGWEKTDLWDIATAIPGVQPIADADGTAAKTFGAETSGHVLLYDADGALRFSGGITAARGHEGPSAGANAILTAMHGGEPGPDRALTFGCPLHSKESLQ